MPCAIRRHAAPLRTTGAALAMIMGITLPGSVVARTVEFLSDLAAVRAAADDQGIPGPFSVAPSPDGTVIAFEAATAADHRVIIASNYCQAYHIKNPVSVLLQDLAASANQAGTQKIEPIRKSNISIRLLSGSTVLRCMGKSDLATICKNRVRITAEASITRADGSTAHAPLVAQVEREGRVGGFCGNIARYTGIVTREAGIELIRQARAL